MLRVNFVRSFSFSRRVQQFSLDKSIEELLRKNSERTEDRSTTWKPQREAGKFKFAKTPKGPDSRKINNNFARPGKDSWKKEPMFVINTGTDAAKEAMKNVIDQVHTENQGKYMVECIGLNDKKNIERCHLSKVVNNIDLAEHGLCYVPRGSNAKGPAMVRKCTVKEMLQQYSQFKAQKKQKELMEMGLRTVDKMLEQKERSEKKKSAGTIINISWDISFNDLKNQKSKEIQKILNKQERFSIILGGRKSRNPLNLQQVDFGDSVANFSIENIGDEITAQKRMKIYDELREWLEPLCKIEYSGDLADKMILRISNIKPTAVEKNSKNKDGESGLSAKELRKLKRTEKQNKKKQTLSEDDLDKLYDLKL